MKKSTVYFADLRADTRVNVFDKIDLLLDGEVQIGDPMNPVFERRVEDANVIAPIPLVGMFINYGVHPRVLIRASAEALDLSIGDHAGRVLQSAFGAEYYFSKLFGLGLLLTSNDINYSQNTEDKKLKVEYRITAVNIYISFAF